MAAGFERAPEGEARRVGGHEVTREAEKEERGRAEIGNAVRESGRKREDVAGVKGEGSGGGNWAGCGGGSGSEEMRGAVEEIIDFEEVVGFEVHGEAELVGALRDEDAPGGQGDGDGALDFHKIDKGPMIND